MRDSIKKIASQFIVSHFPESDIVLIAGSVVHDHVTPESDIDLIIIDETQTPRLECFQFLGWKIEAFIYTEASLQFQLQTARYQGIPTVVKMCAEGKIIKDRNKVGKEIQRNAKTIYEQGPKPWDQDKIKESRYQITDFLSDFRSTDDFGESLFILNKLINQVVELRLRADGCWIGEGKWRARNLKAHNKDFYDKLLSHSQTYFQTKEKLELISFFQSTLDEYGGELFAGYKENFL